MKPGKVILVGILIYGLLIVLLSGCYSISKAKSQFSRAAVAYPELPADYCARTYPVIAKTDSSDYKKGLYILDSLIKLSGVKSSSELTDEERENLLGMINSIRLAIPEPENCDSLSEAIYRLAAKERQRGDYLQRVNSDLILAAKNLKPVHDTIIDRAALDLCGIERGRAIAISTEKTKEADKWRKIARKRFWVILGMGAGMALGVFLLVRRKLVKKIGL